MTLRRTLTRLLLVGSLAATGLVAAAPPAAADFHFMKIREVGLDGPGGSDFVELQMFSPGQTNVSGHTLTIYDEVGGPTVYPLPSDVANGANQATILIATPGFTGPTPDFGDMPNVMAADGGAVCFETIDCVEWGTSGVVAVSADPPAAAPATGQSLERSIAPGCPTLLESGDDTGASATDFAVQPTPNPEPNSTAPNETLCSGGGGGGGGAFDLTNLKTRVKGGRATIRGRINPSATGERVKLTFLANGSPLRRVAAKHATLNSDSEFKKRFKVPSESTRCKVVVRFKGAKLGKRKFKC
jgi:hypothetical protein